MRQLVTRRFRPLSLGGAALAASLVGMLALAPPAGAATVFGVNAPGNTLTTLVTGLSGPSGMGLDSAGDLYIANTNAGAVDVLSKTTTTLFGHSVTANTLTALASGISEPTGVAFDSAGDLFICDFGAGIVYVLPTATGTIFGKSVTANTLTALVTSGLSRPIGIAFDSAGDLFIANQFAGISVLPKATGTLFGVSVVANTLSTVLTAGLTNESYLAFDPSGNLYISNLNTVAVLPKTTSTVYGSSVTANTLTTLFTATLGGPQEIAFDASGDLYVASSRGNTISVLPASTGTLFGVSVTADTPATLVASGLVNPNGVALDPATGDLYISNFGNGTVDVIVPGAPQTITFTSAAPVNASVGGTYAVSATATSGLPVSFTIDSSSTPGACTITTFGVTLTGTGTCVVDANQAGNATFAAATQVQQSFNVSAPFTCSSGTTVLSGSVLLGPSCLSFGAVRVGSSTSTQTVTITNFSFFSSLVVSGESVLLPFHITPASTCPATLGPLQACSVTVSFSPIFTGPVSLALNIFDSATGSPQVIVVSGVGQGS